MLGAIWAANATSWQLSSYFAAFAGAHLCIMAVNLVTQGALVNEAFFAIRSSIAFALATALPLLIWRASERRLLRHRLAVGGSVLLLLVLNSRTALLALPVVIIASSIIVARRRGRSIRLVVMLVFAATTGSALILAVPSLRGAAAASFERFGENSISLDISQDVEHELALPAEQQVDVERRLQALVALQFFTANPLRGGGYMSTAAKTSDVYDREGLSAHGLPSTLLGETGLIGTALFIWIVSQSYRGMRHRLRQADSASERAFHRSVQLTLATMLFFGLFHQLHQIPSFFVLLGWGAAWRPRPFVWPSAQLQRAPA